MRYYVVIFLSMVPVHSSAGSDTANSKALQMPGFSVIAPRLEQATLASAATIYQIDAYQLQQKLPRNLPEALSNTPGVMVQKTANGQGSPFFRGFTGYRTLTLIDGIRYNNSVYRDGPNEYVSLIDVGSLASIELLSGPASAVYGSDAIGGALNLQTKSAGFVSERQDTFFIHGSNQMRYSTAENSFVNRAEVTLGEGGQWGVIAGYTSKHFGNVEAAKIGILPHTGYDEDAFDIRSDIALNANWELTLAHQNLQQDDVWRTHSTIYSRSFNGTEVGDDLKRLKDQKRQLNYIKLAGYDLGTYVDAATLTLSHQQWQEEGDRIKSNRQRIDDFFDSNMYGIDLQLDTSLNSVQLTYGFDYYVDYVDSGRVDYLPDGSVDQVRIQGPVGDDSEYSVFGSYIQAKFDLSTHLSMSVSSRYSAVSADIAKFEDPVSGNVAAYNNSWRNISSAVKASYALMDDHSKLVWFGLSQSFRAPNIADISRYGKSRSYETEVAALGLSPEHFLTYEAGFKLNEPTVQFSASYYYTDINDYITSTPTGKIRDELIEVSKQNSAEGYIHGIEADIAYQWSHTINTFANVTWLEGYLTRATTTGSQTTVTEPFSRIMPLTVTLGMEWTNTNKSCWLGSNLTIVAKADKLSEGDRADTQRIPPGGTSAYQVLNIYSGWQAHKNLLLTLQVNNLLDEAYRAYGSGSNEPSRNLIVGAKLNF